MTDSRSQRWRSLVRRELREYRVSLVWTPFAVAVLLTLLMLAGLFVANQFSNLGEIVLDVISQAQDEDGLSVNLRMTVDEDGNRVAEIVTESTESLAGGNRCVAITRWKRRRNWLTSRSGPSHPTGASGPTNPLRPIRTAVNPADRSPACTRCSTASTASCCWCCCW